MVKNRKWAIKLCTYFKYVSNRYEVWDGTVSSCVWCPVRDRRRHPSADCLSAKGTAAGRQAIFPRDNVVWPENPVLKSLHSYSRFRYSAFGDLAMDTAAAAASYDQTTSARLLLTRCACETFWLGVYSSLSTLE